MARIQLSDHFSFSRLLRFVTPTIIMMLFTSMYGIVDGLFVMHYMQKEAFASITLITPFPLLIGAWAYMIGAGGSAVIAKAISSDKNKDADSYFTFLTAVSIIGSILLAIVGLIFLEPVARLMGASDEMLPHCLRYGRIIMIGTPLYVLENVFQSFLTVAERPKVGLVINLISASLNMFLNFVFIQFTGHAIVSVAVATVVSQMVGGIVPIIYFLRSKTITLHFTKLSFPKGILGEVISNGSSEGVSELFHPLASIMYNYRLMLLIGVNGVAAYGVLMNVGFMFGAIFLGFAIGSAPLFSYNYEKKNYEELHSLVVKSLVIVVVMGFVVYGIACMIEGPFAAVFFRNDEYLIKLTEEAFSLHSLSYNIMGPAVFASAFFTAIHNSKTSALISFLRTLLFEVLAILILPIFFDLNGVWLASLTAELLALLLTIALLLGKRAEYHY
ncbi:MAG: MATE family efflux transporter [Clostridiales bacterium]|nr:MATE family efflux transporter [Clostridiales bacterium]